MNNILDEIVKAKRIELEQWKRFLPIKQLYAYVDKDKEYLFKGSSLVEALRDSSTGVIAEFKRHSHLHGWINDAARAGKTALSYQKGGASAISIVTDRQFFGGYDEHIQEARQSGVTCPILYNNIVIDDYQLIQAKYCGASAVLLMASCISKEECKHLIESAHYLGLEVLLTINSEKELDYLSFQPDIVGVNNRSITTFHADVHNSFRLAPCLPKDKVLVSMGGISSVQMVKELRKEGFKGFIIGEIFMKEKAPGDALCKFIKDLKE